MSAAGMSVTGGCLIAAIAVFRAVFFRQLPKRTLVWLWLAASLVLLIPVHLRAPWSIYGLLTAAQTAASGGAAAAVPTAATSPVWPAIWRGVSIALGACVAAAYGVGLTRFYQGRIIRDPWAERWLCDHPTRRYLTIRQSDQITVPVSGGILRPVILLPAGDTWDEATRACVLAHEFTHICRLDGLVKLICAAALCLHWFNPLVWLMAVLVCRDLEFACDETVLSGETCRADYARALLETETARGRRPLFANGFGAATVKRMEAVAHFRRKGAAAWIASALAAAALVAVFATSPVRTAVKVPEAVPDDGDVQAQTADAVPCKYIYLEGRGPSQRVAIFNGTSVQFVTVHFESDSPKEAVVMLVGPDGTPATAMIWFETADAGEEPTAAADVDP